MISFNHLSIKTKLRALVALSIGLSLLLACVSFLIYDVISFRYSLVRTLSSTADIIGTNSASALLFQDASAAEQTLSALKARPNIIMAGIYTTTGKPFAVWHRNGNDTKPLPEALMEGEKHVFSSNYLSLYHPIVLDGSVVGIVYIQSDLKSLQDRLKRYLAISALVLIVSFLTVNIFSIRLSEKISRPISDLAQMAKAVSEDKNYSVRASGGGRDEIGRLIQTFNEMLTQIQLRGTALRKSHDELEIRVKDRTAELEAAYKELEAFSYSVSHDLRAPLRHIIGFSNILQSDKHTALNETDKRYLNTICDSAKNMGVLIDDLLSFSRMARVQLTKTDVRLDRMARDVVGDFKAETTERGITWNIGALPEIKADPSMIRLVLVNLMSNAVKYTRNASRAIITMSEYNDGPGKKAFLISDNGAGFDMRYADKLFGVFQRLHSTEEFEGTGIGLANVQRIVQRHGGRVWAEGEVGKGATFYVSLPNA